MLEEEWRKKLFPPSLQYECICPSQQVFHLCSLAPWPDKVCLFLSPHRSQHKLLPVLSPRQGCVALHSLFCCFCQVTSPFLLCNRSQTNHSPSWLLLPFPELGFALGRDELRSSSAPSLLSPHWPCHHTCGMTVGRGFSLLH